MSCSRWEADLALYAGGDLPARRTARVEAHLEACGACRSLLEETCASRAILTELRAEPIDDVMAAAVRRRVLARVAAPEAAPARRYWKWALAAALILAAFLAFPRRAPQTPAPALHRVRQGAVPAPGPAPVPVVPARHRPRRTPRPAPQQRSAPPLLVQIVTDDPNIVIYWLVDRKPQGD